MASQSEPKFTPGEWEARGMHIGIAGKTSKDDIASLPASPICAGRRSAEETEANARLIAAAPELYEALAVLLETEDPSLRHFRAAALERARAALAKVNADG